MERIWQAFVADLENGTFGAEKVRPYDASLTDSLVSLVRTLWEHLPRSAWPPDPRSVRTEDRVTYRVDFALPGTTPFYFSFAVAGDIWQLIHVETVSIPLEIPQCPASSFPDLPEETKAFMREEIAATEQVRFLNHLRSEAGWESCMDWVKDGQGYLLAAQTWVPHLPQRLAFILYACWEQQRLRGGQVTLLRLEETSVLLRLKPMCWDVFARSSHLRRQITESDYRDLFEAMWRDRSEAAGWHVAIQYEPTENSERWVWFQFTRADVKDSGPKG